jgi:hypothetical protein
VSESEEDQPGALSRLFDLVLNGVAAVGILGLMYLALGYIQDMGWAISATLPTP